ncbi:class I SAM-dependent methyltransferase [Sinorhizobium meliloti]|jgi:SAM-dependent methyltransferase|uniref:class I SAM-dependent methyltransferase n=1 Tax=Rhizobium meliloti TaxID=382 RepID=UPI00200A0691|nr:class I SAM-dependent methyltransferase [Sinorhizobium meliloti]
MAMASDVLARSFGKQAFGLDPQNYHTARPPYPELVWDALRKRAGLRRGISILEIGAGTGLATERLLEERPHRLLAVEPDGRLARFLRDRLDKEELEVVETPFEKLRVPERSFDLVASATAFHWVDAVPALRRIHRLLRAGGTVALIWNVFGDGVRPDPFHRATAHLFSGHRRSPSGGGTTKTPYGLDVGARLGELAQAGFTTDEPELIDWTLTLDPPAVRRLYATYSNVTALPADERERLLSALEKVAETEFAGVVTRNMTTSVYTGSRE